MKRIIIICEGPTETEFCKDVLYPFFIGNAMHVQTPLIKKSGGGIVSWPSLKAQIINHLQQDTSAIVTTLIDYYGINEKHSFPEWQIAEGTIDRNSRMKILENGMLSSIPSEFRRRFIPYIQLHEFEGLLFNNAEVFKANFSTQEADLAGIEQIIINNPNPELINNGKDTAPSKRLSKLIPGYNKIVHGAVIAEAIGINELRYKSPRFNNWIHNLSAL